MNNTHSLIGFPVSFVPLVRCTHDGAPLQLQGGYKPVEGHDEQNILDGTLTCSRCRAGFPIEGGILDLLTQAIVDPLSATEQRQRNERG